MDADGAASPAGSTGWRDYYALTKPRVVALLVLTSVIGTLLAVPGWPPLNALVFGNLGVALAAASAAAINHVLDRRIDAEMARTRNRPIPTGHLSARAALSFALLLGAIAMLVLMPFRGPRYERASVTFFAGLGKLLWLPRFRPALYGSGLIS